MTDQIDTSDEACAVVCMIVSNPGGKFRQPGWQKRVNDLIRALRDERNRLALIEENRRLEGRAQTVADMRDQGADGRRVFFYEREFYPLSNFSAFRLKWKGFDFDTSEAAYHWEKFPDSAEIRDTIRFAPSAHAAFKAAEKYKAPRFVEWDQVRVRVMKAILIEKALQHEYVRRKLLETGNRELIENSWRDDFWGWGPNGDGQNMLGKLWMEVRAELRALPLPPEANESDGVTNNENAT